MKIHNDHMYHGAALIQIAEHPNFTAINQLEIPNFSVVNTFRINAGVGVHLKYSTAPKGPFEEYVFNFHGNQLTDLKTANDHCQMLWVVLVTVRAREICAITFAELEELIETRRLAKGSDEEQYTVLVNAPEGKKFRVYMNAPGKKKTILGSEMLISRNRFPSVIFGGG